MPGRPASYKQEEGLVDMMCPLTCLFCWLCCLPGLLEIPSASLICPANQVGLCWRKVSICVASSPGQGTAGKGSRRVRLFAESSPSPSSSISVYLLWKAKCSDSPPTSTRRQAWFCPDRLESCQGPLLITSNLIRYVACIDIFIYLSNAIHNIYIYSTGHILALNNTIHTEQKLNNISVVTSQRTL